MTRIRLRFPLSARRRIRTASAATFLALLGIATALCSCAGKDRPSLVVKREQLFSLGYGPAEDQINLFQIDGFQGAQKTCLAMREGIFYVSNGAGSKVVRLSSFGDPLSMIYNPDDNPEPVVLKPVKPKADRASVAESSGLGREAIPYPFKSVGEIAIDSRQVLYIEDRLPQERRVQDKDSGALIDRVVLRFAKDGRFLDYLGQEGIGGTPFPYLLGIYCVASDDVVVVSMLQSAWLVHWFDLNGVLLHSLKLGRDDLPRPEKGKGLIASLDKIVPDLSGRALLIKVDYFEDRVDPATQASAGADFSSSWIYRMDLKDGKYVDRWEVKPIEDTIKNANGQSVRSSRIPSLLGATNRHFFFMYADDDGKTLVSAFDRSTRAIYRYAIDIADDELYYNTFFLSSEGVLCALLGTKYDAKVVWWRFDKLLAGPAAGIVK